MAKSDRQEIEELMVRYGRAIDAKDYPALMRCFTPDAVVCFASFAKALHGHDELETYIRSAVTPLDGTHHMFMNFIVDAEANTGRFTCSVQAQHFKGPKIYTVGGNYVNDVVKGEDGWRMSRLDFKPLWTTGQADLVPHEPATAA